MQFAANLSMLYGGLPVDKRFAAAAQDGFRAAEILQPYDESPQWYAQQLARHGLQLALVNIPVSADYPTGLAGRPDQVAAFRDSMHRAAEVCAATGCRSVHVLAGLRDSSLAFAEQQAALHDNLRWATTQYPSLALNLEALNATDVPGYFYHRPQDVIRELDALGLPAVGLQFDFYHVVKQGLDVRDSLDLSRRWLRHVQIAGAPERHEPDLDRDDLLPGLAILHEQGYRGFVGLEYRPRPDGDAGLAWLQPLRNRGWVRF